MHESGEKGETKQRAKRATQPMTEYDSINDVEVTNEHVRFMRDAGASEMFLDVLKHDVEYRNSVQEEIQKYVYWGKLVDESPESFTHMGGHFFSALWRGDLYEAWCRADLNNKRLLVNVFDKERIVSNGVESGQPIDHAIRMVEQARV